MKKSITIIAAMLFAAFNAFSQAPNWEWSKCDGGTAYDYGFFVTTDASGNIYMAGMFRDSSIIFGSDTLKNTSFDTNDVFLVKYDSNGNVLWARSAGSTYYDYATSIATDASGNVYLTGYFGGTAMVFGADTLINTHLYYYDIFLAKYDSSGNIIWVRGNGGQNDNVSNSVMTDNVGNVYVLS